MGISERRKREKELMRKLILRASMELFVKEGFHNVSIRHIAERIEYSPATIYLYFKNKDEIIYKLNEEGFRELNKRMLRTSSVKDPLERIRKIGEVYIHFGLENQEYYELMFITKATMKNLEEPECGWDCGEEAFMTLQNTVQDCIDSGIIDSQNVVATTIGLWATVHGFVSLIIRERLEILPDEHKQAILNQAQNFILDLIQRIRK
ncbi:MAG: TetR/AcrR family transcriptional regulator [Calditrichaeota bacterium]|nr:MAG: TetR/AcrR family transcriptional regulator [Calditrichota bacterium]